MLRRPIILFVLVASLILSFISCDEDTFCVRNQDCESGEACIERKCVPLDGKSSAGDADSDTDGDVDGDTDSDADSDGNVTWNNTVHDIFKKRCLSCHGPGGGQIDLSTYGKVSLNIGRVKSMVSSSHFINGSDRTKVLQWIDNGYPEK